jgi:hypothetical protein
VESEPVHREYEKALSISAARVWKTANLRMLFQFMQALRRKMVECKVSTEEIQAIIECIGLLTLVEISDIPLAIEYIRIVLNITLAEWDTFWNYFERTWMK